MKKLKEKDVITGINKEIPVVFNPFNENSNKNFNAVSIGKAGNGMCFKISAVVKGNGK